MGWVVSVTPRGKGPRYPLYRRLDGLHESVWTQILEEKSLRLRRGSNLHLPVIQPVAGHYTDWAARLTLIIKSSFSKVVGLPRPHQIAAVAYWYFNMRFIIAFLLTHNSQPPTTLHSTLHFMACRTIAQAVSRQPVTAEARVRARLSSCGICGGQRDRSFSVLQLFLVIIIPLWLSILVYHLGNEHQARWWPQLRDIVSPPSTWTTSYQV
jgi:hypothetical protein